MALMSDFDVIRIQQEVGKRKARGDGVHIINKSGPLPCGRRDESMKRLEMAFPYKYNKTIRFKLTLQREMNA